LLQKDAKTGRNMRNAGHVSCDNINTDE